MDKRYAQEVLEKFLSFPIGSAKPVLETFSRLPGAITGEGTKEKENFVYVPGERKDRVLLVAHADTVWDEAYLGEEARQEIEYKHGEYVGKDARFGIGADDRAGCAMLWYLKDSGHSLLVTDGEEYGQIGSRYLISEHPNILNELNNHAYVIQLDRRGNRDYKTYDLPVTSEFIRYVEEGTGYENAGRTSRTDIVVLCKTVCGVNLGVGYYDEHHAKEKLVFDDWFHTLKRVEKWIRGAQKRFPM